ncbi:MAG: hypothetical protein JRJ68_12170 [Deltaproteobacteria bacterium]|nr:hypothetical protein [Deltaproteobacteria bacterium]
MSEAMTKSANNQPLDEIMLAMDVVDTLRHQEKLVAPELGSDARDEELKERLRKIYKAQGIDVPDHVLDEGVQALKEDRFTYHPPSSSLGRGLARIYINRGRWGKWLLGILVVLLISIGTYQYFVAGPKAALPEKVQTSYTELQKSIRSDRGRELATKLHNQAQTALKNQNEIGIKRALQAMENLQGALDQEYNLKIVARPGEKSGIWRIPDVNSGSRNYYIIVEALDAENRPVKVAVTSEESGKTSLVSKWGVRVDKGVFQSIGADKRDDGIIQKNIFGKKKKGYLVPDYQFTTTGAAITSW